MPNLFSELNAISIYTSNQYSFYLNDDFNPYNTTLLFAPGDSIDYINQSIRNEGAVLIDSYEDGWKTKVVLCDEMRNMYTEECMMETKRSTLCIRYNNCIIWITSGEIKEKADVNLNFSIMDTISYWLAECKDIIEDMELLNTLYHFSIILEGDKKAYYYAPTEDIHDAPHHLETKLSTGGIHYKSGDTVMIYDPVTGEITNSELLDDELDFDIEQFNRQVITENFNKTVLSEIARDIDPENPEEQGKTLIYAVDDQHADMIVSILRDIYSEYEVSNEAIMKITGSVGDGNPKKVQEAIKRFKNENYPSIAVTVDLLTTGIDVPEITTLVFMRRVKSRILFEQMLGRATRLCPKIHKTHFEIYDPVGVYDSLNDVNTMKPVVANPTTSFTQLLDGLSEINDDKQVEQQINQIIAKLQRKKRNMSPKMMDYFISMTDGKDPSQFIMEIEKSDVQEAKKCLLKYRDVFKMLQETKSNGTRPVVVSDAKDELTEHSRGYGNAEKPEDYLNAFSRFIESNRNEIAALNIICTRPRDLTRKDLKDLRLTLDREGFTTQQLNTAIYELTNEEIMADIISLIRRYAIGSTLISHDARIHRAVDKLRKKHNFSKQELSWISHIEKYLLGESVMNIKVFDEDSRFVDHGGFNKINKVFQNNLESIVLELNEYLYDDGGNVA